jgi:23S rRNA (cytidine1920-2'-O)/16S rRNA (cytidine1409-2'-O)-methyltransferase
VTVLERCNIRGLTTDDTGGPFDLVVADLSFISLAKVAGVLAALAAPQADLVVLVKPQFEAGRAEASRGRGIIRDSEVWRRVLAEVAAAFAEAAAPALGVVRSGLTGGDGNVEFVLHARRGAEPTELLEIDRVVSA